MNDKEVFLKSALFYHNEGLNVIPVKEKGKAPAVEVLGGTWEQYQGRYSTEKEIRHWWANGFSQIFNLGIVHMDGYIAIDIDDDTGIFESIGVVFPELLKGRIEQSGSYKGYHIPLKIKNLPNFGYDNKQERPRGNKTWKTMIGAVNIRIAACQTISPPSIHPETLHRYRFTQKGPIAEIDNLNSFIEWLDLLAPPKREEAPAPKPRPAQRNGNGSLVAQVLSAWPTATDVFREFGKVHEIQKERGGGIRLLGNGGLVLTEDEKAWYNFSDEVGGGILAAWAYCRFGHCDQAKHLEQCLIEMAQAGGIDLAPYQPTEETTQPIEPIERAWQQYNTLWPKLRITLNND